MLDDNEGEDEETTGPKAPKEENHTFAPFTVQLDDPAGNSFIEFLGSTADPKWNIRTYARRHAQNVALGIASPDDTNAESDPNAIKKMKATVDQAMTEQSAGEIKDDEILVFPGLCSSCSRPLDTLMKKVNIPYFKVGCHVNCVRDQLTHLLPEGYLHHVYELRHMRLSRQRSEVWICDLGEGEEDRS